MPEPIRSVSILKAIVLNRGRDHKEPMYQPGANPVGPRKVGPGEGREVEGRKGTLETQFLSYCSRSKETAPVWPTSTDLVCGAGPRLGSMAFGHCTHPCDHQEFLARHSCNVMQGSRH